MPLYYYTKVSTGRVMALTWDEMLAYTPQRLGGEVAVEMPWIQVSLPESVIISSVCVLFFGIQLTGPCSVKTYWRLWFGFCFDLISSKVVTWNDWPEGTGLGDVQFPKGFAKQFVFPFRKDPTKENNIQDPSNR